MLISHKHSFIFIHPRKAAGSSITVSLSQHIGTWDLQVGAVADGKKYGITPNARTLIQASLQNPAQILLSLFTQNLWKTINSANKNFCKNRRMISSPHASHNEIRQKYPHEWSSYFKISATRNPWDTMASSYYYNVRNVPNPPTFPQFVTAIYNGNHTVNGINIEKASIPNHALFMENGIPVVDLVIRHESLECDLHQAFKSIGIGTAPIIPHAKNNNSKNNYRDIYTPETREMVAELNETEITYFGYTF